MIEQPGHRTVSLHEWHLVGPEGLPERHRTIQVIRALRPGLRCYTYRFDRRDAVVDTVRGATPGEPYRDPDSAGLTAVDLRLPRQLDIGETASFEYVTVFRWTAVPPPRFRRAARHPVERLDIRVRFSTYRLPAEVHWAVWDGFTEDAEVLAAERVQLAADNSVHRFVEELNGYTVGFMWTWPPGREPVVARPEAVNAAAN